MVRDIRKMKPDSVPVGVDCTLSPILIKNGSNCQSTRVEFNANCNVSSTTAAVTPTKSFAAVKRVVCSPDLPVYPAIPTTTTTARKIDRIVDSPTTQHQPPVQSVAHRKLYHCTICSESFNQRVSLTTHLKMHTKDTTEDPYRCNYCGKTFAVPARLTRHYRTHTGEKPYQCEYCNKSFSVKENLSVHKRIHTKERPYKCEICERAFEHSGKLHRHNRIHTGERPHKCNYCNKTFIQSGQLVIHLRTHTGEKPYVCKTCNKGFTCSKQLKVHSRTHTGEKPYACDICGKSFGYNHVLKLHQVAHYGEKVYKCTICKQTFTSKKDMETHIKMAHSESNQCRSGVENEINGIIGGGGNVTGNNVVSNDKENNLDNNVADIQYLRTAVNNRSPTPVTVAVSPKSTHHLMVPMTTSSSSSSPSPPVYELLHENNAAGSSSIVDNTNIDGGQHTQNGTRCASDLRNFVYARVLANHTQRSSMALLTVTATTTAASAAAMTIPSHSIVAGNGYDEQDEDMKFTQTNKFQIPVAASHYYQPPAAAAVSPSSYSDSSRSSVSPKLEIVEPCVDNAPPLYVLPDRSTAGEELKYCGVDSNLLTNSSPSASSILRTNNSSSPSPPSSSSSVIIHVPYTSDVFSTSSSSPHSNTPSPVSSSPPDIIDLQNVIKAQQMALPPRKRILKSMERDKVIIEEANFRYSSVIQYAKASQIV